MTDQERLEAYESVKAFMQEGRYLSETLPSSHALAKEIAYGTVRRLLSLEYLAKHLTKEKKLKISLKEKALVYIGLYQIIFMDRIPAYAAVNETMQMAKQFLPSSKTNFIHALLRQAALAIPILPLGTAEEDLSIHESYPAYFIHLLKEHYPFQTVLDILKAENKPAVTQARNRKDHSVSPVDHLQTIAESKNYYIQNRTPVELMLNLREKTLLPETILDLCAAPGGKLLLAHDFYPHAKLWANDPSQERMKRLKENLLKYEVQATLLQEKGENLRLKERFDLIILDVPCSNSGVLHKRPEARWRISEQHLTTLIQEQKLLLQNAKTLLAPSGQIWYLTCSILNEENEQLMDFAKSLGLVPRAIFKILPDQQGNDGGFACLLNMENS